MRAILGPIQRFFLPAIIFLLLWSLYRIFLKKDRAAGLVLILALITIVDGFMLQALYIPGLPNGSIRYDELLVFLLFFIKPTTSLSMPSPSYHYINKTKLFFVIYVILYLLGVLHGDGTISLLLTEFRRTAVMPFLVFLLAIRGFDTDEEYEQFGIYLLTYACILSIASVQMMLFDHYFVRSPVIEDKFYHAIRANRRFASFYGNPNHFGGFLVLSMPLFISLTLISKSTRNRILLTLGSALIFFAFFKTYSRGAFIGMGLALGTFMFAPIKGFSLIKKLATITIISSVLIIFVPNLYQSVFSRMDTMEEETRTAQTTISDDEDQIINGASRMYTWTNTLKIIAEHPLTGVGLGLNNYRKYLKSVEGSLLDSTAVLVLSYSEHPHNSYLYLAVFFGIPMLIVFWIIVFFFYKSSYYYMKHPSPYNLKMICLSIICGVTGFLVTIIFDFQLFAKASCMPFWLLLGINLSLLPRIQTNRLK